MVDKSAGTLQGIGERSVYLIGTQTGVPWWSAILLASHVWGGDVRVVTKTHT
jgi:hypothetical protein